MSVDYSENKTDDKPDEKSYMLSWEDQLCQQINDEWTKGQTYVSDLNDLYETLYSMLRGERPERNYDWQSNLVINKVFQIVWTSLPYVAQKIIGATPIIGVESTDAEGAWQREKLLEFWHTMQGEPGSQHTPFFSVLVTWLLRGILNGVGIAKKSWRQKLEIKTEESQVAVPMAMDETGMETEVEPHNMEVSTTIPVEDWPETTVIDNKDIVGDWLLKPGEPLRNGRFVLHRDMVDLDSLYRAGIYMNLDDIDSEVNTADSEMRQGHSEETDIAGMGEIPDSDIYSDVEVYERVGLIPVKEVKGELRPVFGKENIYGNDDVEMKQMICTIAKNQGKNNKDVLIRFEENPYGCINYVDMHIYFDLNRWQSVGMVEPIKDMAIGINDNINAMFDEIWQNLMPPVVVNKFALWDWDTMQYAPQQRWLVGGDPNQHIMFKEPSNITRDAWSKHSLLDSEIQLTTVTNSMQGVAKEKTATTNVMNAQMTAGKLDFLVKMVEVTCLIPSAQFDIKFAKKFAHPATFKAILGKPFQFSDWEETFKYIPAAASVKVDQQKEVEIQQDIQLMQIVASMNNPNVPKILNKIWGNILRNRDMPDEAAMFDEKYFEPQGDAGNMNMLQRMMGPNTPQNEQGLPMSGQERSVRQSTFKPRSV